MIGGQVCRSLVEYQQPLHSYEDLCKHIMEYARRLQRLIHAHSKNSQDHLKQEEEQQR